MDKKQLLELIAKYKKTHSNYKKAFMANGTIDAYEQVILDKIEAQICTLETMLNPISKGKTKESSGSTDSELTAPNTGGDKFTKDFYDGKTATKHELFVHVDQPGVGGDRDTYEGNPLAGVDVGHTFVRLVKTNKDGSKVEKTMGFYPSKPVNPITGVIEVPGELNDDTGHQFEVVANKELKYDNFFAALKYVEANGFNKYNLETYNCTDFAIGVAGAAGWNITTKKGCWPIGLTTQQCGHNPGDLGEDLRK